MLLNKRPGDVQVMLGCAMALMLAGGAFASETYRPRQADIEGGYGHSRIDIANTLTRSGKAEEIEQWFAYGRIRYRPWRWILDSDRHFIERVDLGGFVAGALGSGDMTEDDASYDWKRGAVGLSADIGAWNERMRWLADIGYGGLSNDSESQQGRYRASQDDTFIYVVSHLEFTFATQRRDVTFFPRLGLDFEGIFADTDDFNASWEGTALPWNPFDNSRWELQSELFLLDIPISSGGWRLTPGLKAGLGAARANTPAGEVRNAPFTQYGAVVALGKGWDDFGSIALQHRIGKVDGVSGSNDEMLITVFVDLMEILTQ